MSEKSKIAWCDSTVNFWSGCTKVSPGCANCYAEARDARMLQEKVIHWGKGAPRLKSKSAVKQALAMNRKPWICDECGWADSFEFVAPKGTEPCSFCEQCNDNRNFHRRRIFSLSLGDWLDEEVPIEWLAEMLDTIRRCSDVTWILCTKRPASFNKRLRGVRDAEKLETSPDSYNASLRGWLTAWHEGNAPRNVILLTSVENQAMADKRIPELLKIPAACRGLSIEPLLEHVVLPEVEMEYGLDRMWPKKERIKWLIIGGESGANARPCNVEWIRSIVQQGKAAGVATFVKQLGKNVISTKEECCPHKVYLIDKKGGDISEWPEDLRVQEWPAI